MGKANFSEEFECDAVRQITECDYPVAEVAQRKLSPTAAKGDDQVDEIR